MNWYQAIGGLEALDDPAKLVLQKFQPQVVPAGGILFRPGDTPQAFVLVVSGRIDVHLIRPQGRELLLYSVRPGETCVQTTLGLLGEEDYAGEAVAETDISVVLIPQLEFLGLMDSSAAFRKFVFHAFAQRMQGVTHVLEQVAFVRIEARLASALLDLVDGQGVVSETHQSLATIIGSSREVVSRRLEVLRGREIVDLSRGIVRIIDRHALQNLAD